MTKRNRIFDEYAERHQDEAERNGQNWSWGTVPKGERKLMKVPVQVISAMALSTTDRGLIEDTKVPTEADEYNGEDKP